MKKSTVITMATLLISGSMLLLTLAVKQTVPDKNDPVEETCDLMSHDTIYLAVGEDYVLPDGFYISNDPEVHVEGNVITGVFAGQAAVKSECDVYDFLVSDLYTVERIDNEKPFLPCGRYSREENEYLDLILKKKVEAAGIKTRAGVVAAARFLNLQFRYRLPYFYENGRLAKEHVDVDGEGRYYHRGLYLNEYKYADIDPVRRGPATWGCELYSDELSKTCINGFNCSGYITWVLYNGGYDCGDIGAGPSSDLNDLSDLGEKVYLEDLDITRIKAGDLLGLDGHIAIVLGLHDRKIVIGEAYWEGDLNVEEISYEDFLNSNEWQYAVLMDKYYERDGNYTAYWQ